MLFNSTIFFVFLLIVVPVFYWLRSPRQSKVWLLAASYVFYGFWDWRFCSLLLLSSCIDFVVGQKIDQSDNKKGKKRWVTLSLIANLGILGIFKYFNFFMDSVESALSTLGLSASFLDLNIILPVGISFYTFQTLSYTLDVYRGTLKPTKSFLDFALYVSFFPQLVAGPIERASTLLPQIAAMPKPTKKMLEEGIHLIGLGLFRKVMIGDFTGRYVDHFFSSPERYTGAELLCGLVLFSIQIYADFSGYSHIARGTAKLLGLELMKNFEQPYLSLNITEFWRRWHISLSSWLRDYLYISMGGNRKGVAKMYQNLLVTMLLGGLWHGASWNFVIWGGLHGLYLAFHKAFQTKFGKQSTNQSWVSKLSSGVFTYLLVLITWLFFRSTTWNNTLAFAQQIMAWEPSELISRLLLATASFTLMIILLDIAERKSGKHAFLLNISNPWLKNGLLFCCFFTSMICMWSTDPLPFIYFQF